MENRRILTAVLALCLCAFTVGACSPGELQQLPPTATVISGPTATPSSAPQPSPTPPHVPTSTTPSLIAAGGQEAPDFTLPSVWGDPITLSAYRGQENVVLLFYRTGG
jgi:hypothetical protein